MMLVQDMREDGEEGVMGFGVDGVFGYVVMILTDASSEPVRSHAPKLFRRVAETSEMRKMNSEEVAWRADCFE
jgi:hypothetical protein